MKLGIISDLHLENSAWEFNPDPDVFYLCAGDIGNYPQTIPFIQKHGHQMFYILGNHDWYYFPLENVRSYPEYNNRKTLQLGDLTIAGATGWTPIHFDSTWIRYCSYMYDQECIEFDFPTYRDWHEKDMEFLLNSRADIIVSHHAPSFQSVSPRFYGNPGNMFFCNDLDEYIEKMEYPPKIWIHGHLHNKSDYMIGKTRVIANPRGKLLEPNFENYEPLIIEV